MVPPCSDKVSRAPPYSSLHIFNTPTGLSPSAVSLSRLFELENMKHWPGPRSLATTNGVSVDVLSYRYLDVSVPCVRLLLLYIQSRIPQRGGFPHSEILGSKLVRSSPRLIAAYHVFHRLYAPRHPPNALKTLDHFHYQCSFKHFKEVHSKSALNNSIQADQIASKRVPTKKHIHATNRLR